MIPTRRPIAHQRSQYWNYNLFSSYISSLLSRNIDQAKTLAKWKAFTLKIYSLCNNIRPEIQYKRLQSTFFLCTHPWFSNEMQLPKLLPSLFLKMTFEQGLEKFQSWFLIQMIHHLIEANQNRRGRKRQVLWERVTPGSPSSMTVQRLNCSLTPSDLSATPNVLTGQKCTWISIYPQSSTF